MKHQQRDDTPPNPINPQLLRQSSWLLHRNKKPYYTTGRPRSGSLDSPRDLSKLVPYDAAVAALNTGKFSGLGIAINRGLQFIDLDKCRDAGTTHVEPWVPEILSAAIDMGAFVEVSRSGTGFHIVGHGPAVTSFKSKQTEVYCHGRYMAMGVEVVSTGTDPLPDLGPLIDKLKPEGTARPKPTLRLVASPLVWPGDKVEARRLLKRLDPDISYPEWVSIGMALHKASNASAEGLEVWDTWSKGGEKYKDGVCDKHWAGFKADGGIGMGTLHHIVDTLGAPVDEPRQPRQPHERKMAEEVFEPVTTRRKRVSHRDLMATEHAPTMWAVEGIIAPGVTLLAAPPKMGKSYFMTQMALCVGDGKPFLGRATRKQRVSYFNLEEWEQLIKPRLIDIGAGNDIVDPDVEYILDMDLADDETFLDECQREIDAGSGMIVIDLLARVRDELREDAKKNAYARDYNALKAIADFVLQRNPNVCIVIVHHTNKGNHEAWQDKISGSQGLAGATHTNMVLYNIDSRGVDSETRKKLGEYRKLGIAGKLVPQQDLMLKMLPNRGGWQETHETEEEIKLHGKHAEILQVLREANGRWMTAKEVKEVVPGTLDSIKKMLVRMAQKGEIVSGGTGGPGYRFVTSE